VKVRSADKMQSRGVDKGLERTWFSSSAAKTDDIVIPDPARVTIFWESSSLIGEERSSPRNGVDNDNKGENYGQKFKIIWLSVARISFYRTRGLCDPWNANREVKVAKDGTEVEPSVGKRLLQRYHSAA
jgi:hypothetical protein